VGFFLIGTLQSLNMLLMAGAARLLPKYADRMLQVLMQGHCFCGCACCALAT
jgi:hypothetical protein